MYQSITRINNLGLKIVPIKQKYIMIAPLIHPNITHPFFMTFYYWIYNYAETDSVN